MGSKFFIGIDSKDFLQNSWHRLTQVSVVSHEPLVDMLILYFYFKYNIRMNHVPSGFVRLDSPLCNYDHIFHCS